LGGFFGMTYVAEMGMIFLTWNVRNSYRAGSLEAVASELAEYNFDLVAVQEDRWDFAAEMRMLIITFPYIKETH
jgi:hypothetical protein